MLGQLMLASACTALGLILWTWIISLRLDDASVIDVAWGIGFVLIAAICGYMAGLIGSSNSPISGVGILAVVLANVVAFFLVRMLAKNLKGEYES